MEKYMPFIWIGFAIVMAICEAATTQLVSIWFVVGAVAAAVTTIFTPNIFIQLIVFLAFSAAALLITSPIAKRLKNKTNTVTTDELLSYYECLCQPIGRRLLSILKMYTIF